MVAVKFFHQKNGKSDLSRGDDSPDNANILLGGAYLTSKTEQGAMSPIFQLMLLKAAVGF
jgi:hypothetical protein